MDETKSLNHTMRSNKDVTLIVLNRLLSEGLFYMYALLCFLSLLFLCTLKISVFVVFNVEDVKKKKKKKKERENSHLNGVVVLFYSLLIFSLYIALLCVPSYVLFVLSVFF